jgi:hypothetical protein
MAAATRALQLYPLENQAVVNALAELDATARALMDQEGELSVRYVGDFFFVNDVRLRIDLASYATFGLVGRALHRHGIGTVEAFPGAGTAEWTAFLSLLMAEPHADDRFGHFAERLARSAVLHLAVHPDQEPRPGDRRERQADGEARLRRRRGRRARDDVGAAHGARGVSIRPVKRAVQSIVDQVLTNETSIFGLTTLRDYDEYTFTHS